MIDLLELSIQFDSSLVDTIDDRHAFVGVDLKELHHRIGGLEKIEHPNRQK